MCCSISFSNPTSKNMDVKAQFYHLVFTSIRNYYRLTYSQKALSNILRNKSSIFYNHEQSHHFCTSIIISYHFQTLNISGNNFSTLANEVGDITSLTHLNISKNIFSILPTAIGAMRNLQHLLAANNVLTHLGIHPPLLKVQCAEKHKYLNVQMWCGNGIKIAQYLRSIDTYAKVNCAVLA